MNKLKLKRFLATCVLAISFTSSSCGVESNNSDFDDYSVWEDVLEDLVKRDGAVEMSVNDAHEILQFAKRINHEIMSKNVDFLIKIMSKKDFRFYYIKSQKSPNYSKIIPDHLRNKKHFYCFMFDKTCYFKKDNSASSSGHTDRGKIYDIRKYLIEYEKRIKWRILYLKKDDTYDVWFSIPTDLIAEFDYFHYRIKVINSKMILVGF